MRISPWRSSYKIGPQLLKCRAFSVFRSAGLIFSLTDRLQRAMAGACHGGVDAGHWFLVWLERCWLNARQARLRASEAQTQILAIQLMVDSAKLAAQTQQNDNPGADNELKVSALGNSAQQFLAESKTATSTTLLS